MAHGESPIPKHPSRVTRWVYFCQPIDGGPIKIGVALDPKMRMYSLQAGSPVPLRMLAIMPGGEAKEAELHRRFAEYRLHGEWFQEDTPGLAEVIADAKAAILKVAERRLPELEAGLTSRAQRLQEKIAEYQSNWRIVPDTPCNTENTPLSPQPSQNESSPTTQYAMVSMIVRTAPQNSGGPSPDTEESHGPR